MLTRMFAQVRADYRRLSNRRRRLARRVVGPELLDQRLVLTTTLFLDFGAGIGMGNTLTDTVVGFRDIFGANTGTDMGTNGDGDPSPFSDGDPMSFTPLNYDFNLDGILNNLDLTDMAAAVVPLVQRALEPLDINVVVSAAATLANAVTSVGANAGDATGEFDAYVFITTVTSNAATVPSGLFGRAAITDLGAQTGNNTDEAALTFANNVFNSTPGTQGTAAFNDNLVQRLAFTATHEAFHTFTYVHTPDEDNTNPPASADQRLLASGDVIRRGSNTRDNPFIVTRFDLLHGSAVPEPNNYLTAANDPDIGLRDSDSDTIPNLAYVTGTGAHDQVVLSDAGGSVDVDVNAYNNSTRTTLIASESYSIDLLTDTEGEILVDASINNDEVLIDARIDAALRLRGGIGIDGISTENDLLTLDSFGLTGSYTPGSPGAGLVTYVGGAAVDFSEFENVEADNIPIDVDPLVLVSNVISEGSAAQLSGSFVNIDTLDIHTVTIDWGDGTPNSVLMIDPGDREFAANHVYRDDNPSGTPSDGYTITVTIVDQDGDSGGANTGITVLNVDPVFTTTESSATFATKGKEGEPVDITAEFTDVGVDDTHSATIDWGDGSPVEVANVAQGAGSGVVTASHPYAFGGIYTVTIVITDDDTGTDQTTTLAVITGVGVNNGVLYIIGSDEPTGDHASVNLVDTGLVRVHADFIPEPYRTFDLADIDKVISYLGEGNDILTIAGNVQLPAIVHGDGGDDHIDGGAGGNVLLGGDGHDHLNGGTARDILIGGTGRDRMVGGGGDDVLVGGSTGIDLDDDALLLALTVWSDPTDSYDVRVAAVDAVLAGVIDDGERDGLNGGSDRDLFYNGFLDLMQNRKPDETLL